MRLTDFYPRPPRGGRPAHVVGVDVPLLISIHALREEGDWNRAEPYARHKNISIHALREEGDAAVAPAFLRALVISIHALREEGD